MFVAPDKWLGRGREAHHIAHPMPDPTCLRIHLWPPFPLRPPAQHEKFVTERVELALRQAQRYNLRTRRVRRGGRGHAGWLAG